MGFREKKICWEERRVWECEGTEGDTNPSRPTSFLSFHSFPLPMTKGNHTHYECGCFLCSFFTIFLLLAGTTALTVWLVYHPSHPRFNVVAAAIYTINTTSPQTISTTMQFTLVLYNPSKRTTIFYDRLSASVSYRNQAVTLPMSLHELFQEPKSRVALSPMVGGECVPVSQEVLDGLVVDQEYGVVGLRVELMGRLRYKAGPFWSKHYRMYVKCDVLVGVKEGVDGQAPLLGSPDCVLDV